MADESQYEAEVYDQVYRDAGGGRGDADDASLLPNLTLLVEGLRTLREGVLMAIEGYREEDDSVSLVFKNIGEA